MKKATLTSFMFLLLFILTACSNDGISSQERMDTFITHWNEQNFEKMYHMLSEESAKSYGTEQFIDRYQKIYDDLDVSNLHVSLKKLTKEEIKDACKKNKATVQITVQ